MNRRAPAAPYINNKEQEQPDDIDKMPIPSRCLKAKMLLWREMPFVSAGQTNDQEDRAYKHVETVETGRHIKGTGIVEACKGEWRDAIFISLNCAEQ